MIIKTTVLNIYSEMNEWIDFYILPVEQEDAEQMMEIINLAYDNWFNDVDAGDMPLLDYICRKIDFCSHDLKYEIYQKVFA